MMHKSLFVKRKKQLQNSVISKGIYAVGYVNDDCGNTDQVYKNLISFIWICFLLYDTQPLT